VDQITSQDKAIDFARPLDSTHGSFVQVDRPQVVLVTWKRAEDGDGTVLRFVEVGRERDHCGSASTIVECKIRMEV